MHDHHLSSSSYSKTERDEKKLGSFSKWNIKFVYEYDMMSAATEKGSAFAGPAV